jgi:hypothetical protein
MSTLTRERAAPRARLLPAAAAAAFLAAATLSGTAVFSLLLGERPALELTTPQAGLSRPEGRGFLRATEPSSYRGAAFTREQYAAVGGHLERAEETPLSRTGFYYRLQSGHLEHAGLQEGPTHGATSTATAAQRGRQPMESFE